MSQTQDQQRFTASETAADQANYGTLCSHSLPAIANN